MPLAPAIIHTPSVFLRIGRWSDRCVCLFPFEGEDVHLSVAFHYYGIFDKTLDVIEKTAQPFLTQIMISEPHLEWVRNHHWAAHILNNTTACEILIKMIEAIDKELGWEIYSHSRDSGWVFKVGVPDAVSLGYKGVIKF